MKKIVFFLLLVVTLAGCKGDDGIDGRDGKDGKDGIGTNWLTIPIKISEKDWVLEGHNPEGNKPNDTGTFYSARVDIKELTQWVYDEGTVLTYYVPTKGVKVGLPHVSLLGEDDKDGKPYTWTETIRSDFSTGEMYFYVTYSDFSTEYTPVDMTFHVVLMW